MDRLDESNLRLIETELGRRVVSEFGLNLSGLVLDMTNFATYINPSSYHNFPDNTWRDPRRRGAAGLPRQCLATRLAGMFGSSGERF
jgi:hypothetical protein